MSTAEIAAGNNAVRFFVFSDNWQNMRFAKEPDLDSKLEAFRDKKGNPAEQLFFLLNTSDEFESAAEKDPVCARKYSTTFHRAQRSMVLRHKSKPTIIMIDSESDENEDGVAEDGARGPSTVGEEEKIPISDMPIHRRGRGRSASRRGNRLTSRGAVAKTRETTPPSVSMGHSSPRRSDYIKMEDLTVN